MRHRDVVRALSSRSGRALSASPLRTSARRYWHLSCACTGSAGSAWRVADAQYGHVRQIAGSIKILAVVPVISVTHVGLVRPESDHRLPAILVAGKQIFATHYVEGGLGLTVVVRDATNGAPYLAYVSRSQIDLLRVFFGGFVRGVLEDRVEGQAPLIIRGLRARLESGNPPDEPADPFTNDSRGVR